MKTAYSCVVDAHPKFEWQALLWVNSLLRCGCPPEDLKVHCMPGVTENLLASLRRLHVNPVATWPFENGPAYCNKMQQCDSTAFDGYDKAVLADVDLFFLAQPQLPEAAVFAGKLVDLPNPPLAVLKDIYREAGVPFSKPVPVDCALGKGERTFKSNMNGGFYYLDAALLKDLGRAWEKHARWLIKKVAAGARLFTHIDQVAMALALDEMKIDVTILSALVNFPVHLDRNRLGMLPSDRIAVLHYHSKVLPSGEIMSTGVPNVDEAIARANREIVSIIGENTDNLLFWNNRYACFPELGSGAGSRGDVLQYKKMLLGNALALFKDRTVLEVGCGDLETSRDFAFTKYVGYDLSSSALAIARQKRPDWRFVQGTLQGAPDDPRCDLVLCLDVLIHQKEPQGYHNLVKALADAAQERLIVSGYESAPEIASNITAFHEPLSVTLRKTGRFRETMVIGKYRDVSLLVADKKPTGPALHASDLPIDVFNTMTPLIERPDLLRLIMDTSRDKLGFYTLTSSRTIEYPWLIDKLTRLPAGSRILDIGSGISPLPIMLAERGMLLSCVDAHPRVRTRENSAAWNEWGFLDYAQYSPRIRSYHSDIREFQPDRKFDAVYSVSVLEHMPRTVWERTLDLLPAWLNPGGYVLLTLDLIPGSYALWNKSEGKTVDAEGNHGKLEDIKNRLKDLGFYFEELSAKQNIPHAKTDVAFVLCRLGAKPEGPFRPMSRGESPGCRDDRDPAESRASQPARAGARKQQLYLHIGTPKTGTSAIQSFLYQNYDALRAEGILYPKSIIQSAADPKQQSLFAAVQAGNRRDFIRLIQLLASESDEKATVTVSSEGFYHHTNSLTETSWELIRILDLLYDMRIIVFLRPQADFIESLYRQYIKNPKGITAEFGSSITIHELLRNQRIIQNMDYYGTLMKWAKVVGTERILVRRYSEHVVGDLAAILDMPAGKYQDGTVRNRSLTREMAELLRQINPSLDNDRRNQVVGRMELRLEERRERDTTFLSPSELREIMDQCEEGNANIANKWFPGEARLFSSASYEDSSWEPVNTSREQAMLLLKELYEVGKA